MEIMIETERLLLEKLTIEHMEGLYSLLSNKAVHKYFPKVLNRSESEEFFKMVQRHYQEDGYCFWAVIRKSDSKFIGICGPLKQIIDDIEEIEVAYRIIDSYWGNGYGTEAASGCIEYIKNILKKKSVIALIRPVNQQSIRVAEKNGMHLEKETFTHGYPHLVFRKYL